MGKNENKLGWDINILAHEYAKENKLSKKEELSIRNELRKKHGMAPYTNLTDCPDREYSSLAEKSESGSVGKIVAAGAVIGLGLLGLAKFLSDE